MSTLHFGVFEVYGPQTAGTFSWAHPLSDSIEFTDPEHWIRMAKVMDETGYDFLFFADSYGYPIVGEDISATAVAHGINFSGYDPATLLPLLMHATRDLGFVVTSTTGMDHPLQLARRFSTLDLLSRGRFGWNVVTGSAQNAVAELLGHEGVVGHATRYAMAAEYVELAKRYWQDGWDDDAVVADRELGRYVRRDGLHRIEFRGEHYRSSGYFSSPPTPQRTPVIFQAGTSAAGKALAAQHAECVFVQATTRDRTAADVADLRRLTAANARSVTAMAGLTVFVADTSAEAHRLASEFDAMQTDEMTAALYAGNTGIDLLALDPERTLHQVLDGSGVAGQMGTSNIDRFLGPEAPTVRQILDSLRGRGTRGFRITGSGTEVADGIEDLAASTGLDGFLLEPVFGTRDVAAFGDLVLPLLRERGRLPDHSPGATLRSRLSPGA